MIQTYTHFGFAIMLNDTAGGKIKAGTCVIAISNNLENRIKSQAKAKTFQFYLKTKAPLTKAQGFKNLRRYAKRFSITETQLHVLDTFLATLK